MEVGRQVKRIRSWESVQEEDVEMGERKWEGEPQKHTLFENVIIFNTLYIDLK